MRKTWFGTAAIIGALFASTSVLAQTAQDDDAPVYLIADQVFLDGEDLLVASGHVEARQGERRLIAEKITYNQDTDTLTIEGNIRLEDGSTTVVLADAAELSDDMREGLLQGARMILGRPVATGRGRDAAHPRALPADVQGCRDLLSGVRRWPPPAMAYPRTAGDP